MVTYWVCPFCGKMRSDTQVECPKCSTIPIEEGEEVGDILKELAKKEAEKLFDHDDVVTYDPDGPDGGC